LLACDANGTSKRLVSHFSVTGSHMDSGLRNVLFGSTFWLGLYFELLWFIFVLSACKTGLLYDNISQLFSLNPKLISETDL
jgi:hypothetical protein